MSSKKLEHTGKKEKASVKLYEISVVNSILQEGIYVILRFQIYLVKQLASEILFQIMIHFKYLYVRYFG